MDPVTALLIMLLCLVLEAFFSDSEIGIVSADRAKLLHKAEQRSRGTQLALEMLKKPEWLLSTTLVGTNISIVTNTTVTTMLVVSVFGDGWGWLAAAIVAPLSWVFGEIVAKNAFQHHADTITPKVIGLVRFASYIFFPILVVFGFPTRFLARLSGQSESNPFTIREEIDSLMQMKSVSGDVDPEEQSMIRRIFEFHDTSVSEVLTPLIDVIGIPDSATCGQAAKVAVQYSHHRLPVYRERVDNVVGILNALDLLGADRDDTISQFVSPVRFIPASQNVEELLVTLRMSSQRMAVVVDEYGGIDGIVTIKDLLEEVVGEITDEHDVDESQQMIEKINEKCVRVNARIDIRDLARATPVNLPDGNYETLGGFLIDLAREIPEVGSVVKYRKFEFSIEEVSDRTIRRVGIKW